MSQADEYHKEYANHDLILDAATYMADAHAGQLRKELNEPYCNHPLRCAKLASQYGFGASFIAGLLLHDVVEDTKKTIRDLEAHGFPVYTITLVSSLTKWWDGRTPDAEQEINKVKYYGTIIDTPGGPEAKVIDRVDNLRDMLRTCHQSPNANRWAARYLAKTLKEFPPVLKALRAKGDAHAAELLPGQTHTNVYIALADLFDLTVASVAKELSK